MINQIARKSVVVASAISMLAGCGKSGGTYSILADADSYKQEAAYVPKKIDILWIIDNSGSMQTSQNNLAENFKSFIQRFQTNNNDFRMAVGTTEAWRGSSYARLRNNAGYYVMDKNTPNLETVFVNTVKQGINGSGDERAFQSMKDILALPANSTFRRPDAFLAVIIVSDEEDFSHSGSSLNESYTNPNLYTVQSFIDWMDGYTGGIANGRNYSVSNIAIQTTQCRDQLRTDKFPKRYHEITQKTAGINGDLCADFGQTLEIISDSIAQLSSSFKLTREPIPESIVVTVNGSIVARDSVNGWTYDATTMTITFHGTAIPAASSDVKINFDPKSIKI
ncbi:hypothetical protein ACLVWU_06900 [Bdellovibrio sp. HCB290]|uniref:hypothetical protein n=1 Tax=Bdellovibrio sp. HCB290 TaxID=3394356 RepID=UPI0039B5BB8B